MNEYALVFLAGVWFADGVSLLIAPRAVMDKVREAAENSPGIFRWQIVTVIAGLALLILGWQLTYRHLWIITSLGMVAKGLFLSLGPAELRGRLVAWCIAREDVDYRFCGLGLCTLAVLLLHALGWIGQA